MKAEEAPIVKAAERLMLEIERDFPDFPKKRRRLAERLSDDAIEVALLAQDAFRSSKKKQRQAELIERLSRRVDSLKLRMQVAQQLQCFPSSRRFNDIFVIARSVGMQCGAWKEKVELHLQGQNPGASAPLERAEILSSRAASQGANP